MDIKQYLYAWLEMLRNCYTDTKQRKQDILLLIRSVQVYVLDQFSIDLCSLLGQCRSMFLTRSAQVYVLDHVSTDLCS